MKIKNSIYLNLLLGLLAVLMINCNRNEINKNYDDILPLLTTDSIIEITKSTAISGGNVSNDRGATVIAKGVCWSSLHTPTIMDSITSNGKGTDSFTSDIIGLKLNTTYYVRAYATTFAGTGYGNLRSFKTLPENFGNITDIDGNIYHTVTIGTQTWMMENLKVTHYRNGDPIPEIHEKDTWIKITTGATTYLSSDPQYISTYGRLYNWYSVADTRNICPVGWHIPSKDEWYKLILYLPAGLNQIKSNIGWKCPGNNEIGFCATPGGRFPLPTSESESGYGLYYSGTWWSSTEKLSDYAYCNIISCWFDSWIIQFDPKFLGYSVRCIKD